MLPNLPPRWRLPLLLLGALSLLFGVFGGLARLAVELPPAALRGVGAHGALMISAFFGAVISLERAVALGRGELYLAPLAAGLGGVALLLEAPPPTAPALFVVAGVLFVGANVLVVRQLTALFTLTLAGGALCWLVGNMVWAFGGDPGAAIPFWIAFLVLTIAGERLELTRMLPPKPGSHRLFAAVAALLAVACVVALWNGDLRPLAGVLVVLAAWLARYDIARQTVRQRGLPRFVAVCLLSGYAWLAVGGILGLLGAFAPGHALRDAALHAVFLGFVFSMVIGHAPIVFPAVLRVKIPYHAMFYAPVVFLHLSLAMRLIGNLVGVWPLRQWSAVANALALGLFVATLLSRVAHGFRRSRG